MWLRLGLCVHLTLLEGDYARAYLVLLNDHDYFLFAYHSYHSRNVHPKLVSQWVQRRMIGSTTIHIWNPQKS